MIILFAILTFISTFLGGLTALKYKDKFHLILGFTAGVILGVVTFDILPEIFELLKTTNVSVIYPMIALVSGFLIFHILEKLLLMHHDHEEEYGSHHHPTIGIVSALALAAHSFLDGVGIGLGFQVAASIGIIVAIAVISHDFSDGLNTVTLVLRHKNSDKKALMLLALDALAPVLGVISTLFFTLSENILTIYLGFFAGFLLYICSADILPEAHSHHSSYGTIMMTILGVIFIFTVTRLI